MIVYWHCGASIPFKYASRCTFDTHLINPPHSHYDEWLLIQIISTSLATPPPPKKKKNVTGTFQTILSYFWGMAFLWFFIGNPRIKAILKKFGFNFLFIRNILRGSGDEWHKYKIDRISFHILVKINRPEKSVCSTWFLLLCCLRGDSIKGGAC